MTNDQVEKYLSAAEQGDATSQYSLGKFYEQGQRLGFDYPKIEGMDADVYWYHKAAEQGHIEAQYTLGMYYLRGIGVDRNRNLANGWFAKAAELGHERAKSRLK